MVYNEGEQPESWGGMSVEEFVRLRVVEETGSTNDDLKKESGAPHGTALMALRQTDGKGRLGRSFVSPPGGVYFSLLLRPKVPPEQLLHLTAMAAVALRRGIKKLCDLEVGIKWTNDLVFEGKKLCGILTELVTRGEFPTVIVGVGLNCNTTQEDFPSELRETITSLKQITGKSYEPQEAAQCLLDELWHMSRVLFSEKEQWLREYRAACVTLGKEIRILRAGDERNAFALDIDENGGLLVEYADGGRGTVNTGEVSVRGMYGYL